MGKGWEGKIMVGRVREVEGNGSVREGKGRAGMGKGSLEKMERSKQIPISIESFG